MKNVELITVLLIYITFADSIRAESAKLTVELLNSGFHRDLKYGVVFPDFQGISYTFMIKQKIPASVYVSTDQLDDLRRLEKLSYSIEEDRIDIEKPTEKSESFFIYLYGDTSFLRTIKLPIHFRYHAPGNKSFVTVSIDYPVLYIDTNDEIKGLNATEAEWYTCEDLRHRCRWNQVEYDNYSRRLLSANIPIGNASLGGTITFFTILTSWAACAFILFYMRKKSRQLTSKLSKGN